MGTSLVLEQVRNSCSLAKITKCGFPWEKTTKRPIASRISCSAALAENKYVRLSSQKVAMQFSGSTKLYRKSRFDLHPLRDCFSRPVKVRFYVNARTQRSTTPYKATIGKDHIAYHRVLCIFLGMGDKPFF
jgi:hypothetical protein